MYKRMILVAALALAGCQSAPEPTPAISRGTPTETQASASSTPTMSSSPLTSEGATSPALPESEAAVLEAWRSYWDVFQMLMQDASVTDLSPIGEVTIAGSPEEQRFIDAVVRAREAGETFEGELQFRDIAVELQPAAAEVSFCFDRSNLKFLDATGQTLESNTDTLLGLMTLEQDDEGRWKVSDSQNEIAPC